jgi:hypothetical protein
VKVLTGVGVSRQATHYVRSRTAPFASSESKPKSLKAPLKYNKKMAGIKGWLCRPNYLIRGDFRFFGFIAVSFFGERRNS